MNSENLAGQCTRIRAQCLQNLAWTPNNIISGYLDTPFLKMGKNLAHDTIYMLHQYSFSWINHKAISNIHKIDQTIEEIMGNKWFSNNRQALRKHRIMFIGQCLNLNSTKLLEWTQLTNPKEQEKKCKPQWYSELENKIILSNNPD